MKQIGISVVIVFYGLVTLLWAAIILWVGWKIAIMATLMGGAFVISVTRWSKLKAQNWIPRDAHDMARALKVNWDFTVEEGWEIVDLMEHILRAEHTDPNAWMFVRILMLRTDKDRTLGILRTLAGESTKQKYPTTFPRVLNT